MMKVFFTLWMVLVCLSGVRLYAESSEATLTSTLPSSSNVNANTDAGASTSILAKLRHLAHEMRSHALAVRDVAKLSLLPMKMPTSEKTQSQTATVLSAQGRELDKKLNALIQQLTFKENNPKLDQKNPQRVTAASDKTPRLDSSKTLVQAAESFRAVDSTNRSTSWYQLPPSKRDAFLQSFCDDLPERWRNRLKAYFKSVANESYVNPKK